MSLQYIPNSGVSWSANPEVDLFQVKFTNSLSESVVVKSLTVPLAYGNGTVISDGKHITFMEPCTARCFVVNSNYDTTAEVTAKVESSGTSSAFNNLDGTQLVTFNFESGNKVEPGESIIFRIRYYDLSDNTCVCSYFSNNAEIAQRFCSVEYQTSVLKIYGATGRFSSYNIYTYPGKTINLADYPDNSGALLDVFAFKLLGWSDTENGPLLYSVDSTDSQNFSIESDTTLYEVWQECYYINFYENSTATEPSESVYLFEDTLTIPPDITCNLSGCTFKGWSTDPTDTEIAVYSNGDSVSVSTLAISPGEDLDFYPVFINTLKFYTTAGTLWRTCEKRYDVPIILPEESPSMDFHRFDHWLLSGTDEKYYPQGEYVLNQDADFDAVYEPMQYTLSFNANGGQNPPADIIYRYSTGSISIPAVEYDPTREHYEFKGWSDAPDSAEVIYSHTGINTYSCSQTDKTLYAVWVELPKYTVKFDTGPSTDIEPQEVYQDDSIELPSISLDGYTLLGWSATNNKADVLPGGSSYTVTGDITFYAMWEKITYTLSFDANGGMGEPDSTTYAYGAEKDIKLSETIPTYTGYTFLGWSTSSTSTIPEYQPGDSLSLSKDQTVLYAVWKLNDITSGNSASSDYIKNPGNYSAGTDWAVTFNRKAAIPLDRSSLFSSLADARAYAQGNGSDSRGLGTTAYVGQIVSVYDSGQTNSVSVYVIAPNGVLAHISAGDINLDINYATDEDVVEILTNLNIVTPVADEDGASFTV